jgi:hypothetical protein
MPRLQGKTPRIVQRDLLPRYFELTKLVRDGSGAGGVNTSEQGSLV